MTRYIVPTLLVVLCLFMLTTTATDTTYSRSATTNNEDIGDPLPKRQPLTLPPEIEKKLREEKEKKSKEDSQKDSETDSEEDSEGKTKKKGFWKGISKTLMGYAKDFFKSGVLKNIGIQGLFKLFDNTNQKYSEMNEKIQECYEKAAKAERRIEEIKDWGSAVKSAIDKSDEKTEEIKQKLRALQEEVSSGKSNMNNLESVKKRFEDSKAKAEGEISNFEKNQNELIELITNLKDINFRNAVSTGVRAAKLGKSMYDSYKAVKKEAGKIESLLADSESAALRVTHAIEKISNIEAQLKKNDVVRKVAAAHMKDLPGDDEEDDEKEDVDSSMIGFSPVSSLGHTFAFLAALVLLSI